MSSSRASPLPAVVALALAVAVAVPAAAPALAAAKPPKRKLCVERVTVRDAPHGFAVGYLYRPQTLSVFGRPVDHWVLIGAHDDLMGWVPERALCRARAH